MIRRTGSTPSDLFALAAQKHYVSLYLLASTSPTALGDLLPGLDCGKGCIRFKARTEIPEEAVGRLLVEAAASTEHNCGKG